MEQLRPLLSTIIMLFSMFFLSITIVWGSPQIGFASSPTQMTPSPTQMTPSPTQMTPSPTQMTPSTSVTRQHGYTDSNGSSSRLQLINRENIVTKISPELSTNTSAISHPPGTIAVRAQSGLNNFTQTRQMLGNNLANSPACRGTLVGPEEKCVPKPLAGTQALLLNPVRVKAVPNINSTESTPSILSSGTLLITIKVSGNLDPSDFTIPINGTDPLPPYISALRSGSAEPVKLSPGHYTIRESRPGYKITTSSGCLGMIGNGQTDDCIITISSSSEKCSSGASSSVSRSEGSLEASTICSSQAGYQRAHQLV